MGLRIAKRHLRMAGGLVAAATLTLVGALGFPAEADADGSYCFPLLGTFSSQAVPPPECTSPVGLCTAGSVHGALNGDYAFTMNTLVPSGDPTVPAVHFFTGRSEINTALGQLIVGTDTGTIDLDESRFGNFVTLITFVDGTEYFDGATGQIALRGQLDFATGGASGTYKGEVCFP